jgi:hypothetical protein
MQRSAPGKGMGLLGVRLGGVTKTALTFLAARAGSAPSTFAREAIEKAVAEKLQAEADAPPPTAAEARAATVYLPKLVSERQYLEQLPEQFNILKVVTFRVLASNWGITDVAFHATDVTVALVRFSPSVFGEVIELASVGEDAAASALVKAQLEILEEVDPPLFKRIEGEALKPFHARLLLSGAHNPGAQSLEWAKATADRASIDESRRQCYQLEHIIRNLGRAVPAIPGRAEAQLERVDPPWAAGGVAASRHASNLQSEAVSRARGAGRTRRRSLIDATPEQGVSVGGRRPLISKLPQE